MYQSPINLIVDQMRTQMEDEIFKAVQNVGVYVDKDELLKALQYDRDQYQKGYNDRDAEIVRCENCKRRLTINCWCDYMARHDPNWFCAAGERDET